MAIGIHTILRQRAKANAKRRHATTIAWNSDISANPHKCATPAVTKPDGSTRTHSQTISHELTRTSRWQPTCASAAYVIAPLLSRSTATSRVTLLTLPDRQHPELA